jgi:hypothetical protein
MDTLQSVAMAAGLAWASGIRLYAVLFVTGFVGMMGWVALPEHIRILEHPLVLGAAGFMVFVEFFADKIPGVDTIWDIAHTFVRIPAGAALAAGVFGADSTVMTLVAGILGGMLASGSHLTKTGSRVLINTSPEPWSNWGASLGEDALVMTALWAALKYPLVLLALLALFLLVALWLLPRLFRAIVGLLRRMGLLLAPQRPQSSAQPASPAPPATP